MYEVFPIVCCFDLLVVVASRHGAGSNDDTVRYLYNSLDSLTELRYTEDERVFAFAYYDSGETALQKDYVSNRLTRLNHDENGNILCVQCCRSVHPSR